MANTGIRVKVWNGDQTEYLGMGTYVGDVPVVALMKVVEQPDGVRIELISMSDDPKRLPEPIPEGCEIRELPDNPKILLDSGKTVYGCQVWWEPEEEDESEVCEEDGDDDDEERARIEALAMLPYGTLLSRIGPSISNRSGESPYTREQKYAANDAIAAIILKYGDDSREAGGGFEAVTLPINDDDWLCVPMSIRRPMMMSFVRNIVTDFGRRKED